MDIDVRFKSKALKQFTKLPKHVQLSVSSWLSTVEKIGTKGTAKLKGKGLHDEPLSGRLQGLRSIRLSKAWRLYYRSEIHGNLEIVSIERIDHHKY
jgi:proteic killer suppression protein